MARLAPLRLQMRSIILLGVGVTVLAFAVYVRVTVDRHVVNILTPTSAGSSVPNTEGTLVICGGGPVPDTARRAFVELAGGPAARLVVIPATQEDESSLSSYLDVWKDYQPLTFNLLTAQNRQQANDAEYTSVLDQATGVWFGGGQQSWLISRYADTLVETKLRELLRRNGVIGGTSAGAAVMSEVMVLGGRKDPVVGKGFGFLPDVVIDQHFLKRNRFGRLRSVLDRHTNLIGLGIDEKTALVYSVARKQLKVLGQSYVVACVPCANRLDVEFLQAGDTCLLADLRNSQSVFSSAVEEAFFE